MPMKGYRNRRAKRAGKRLEKPLGGRDKRELVWWGAPEQIPKSKVTLQVLLGENRAKLRR